MDNSFLVGTITPNSIKTEFSNGMKINVSLPIEPLANRGITETPNPDATKFIMDSVERVSTLKHRHTNGCSNT